MFFFLIFILGALCGFIGMAIIAGAGRDDEMVRYYNMKNVLLQVLAWHRNKGQGAFPEKDVLNALEE